MVSRQMCGTVQVQVPQEVVVQELQVVIEQETSSSIPNHSMTVSTTNYNTLFDYWAAQCIVYWFE